MKTLKSKLSEAQAAYHAIVDTGTSADLAAFAGDVKQARAAIAAALVAGAAPCPKCGATPHGMHQPQEVEKSVAALIVKTVPGAEACPGGLVMVEIGCLTCAHHRARGFTQAMAVEAWNHGAAVYAGITITGEPGAERIAGLPEAWFCPKTKVRL